MPYINLDAKIESLEIAREFLHKVIDPSFAKISMMELAIEEILINVINYAYNDVKDSNSIKDADKFGKIEFGLRKIRFDNQPYYAIWVKDWGKSFDPFEDVSEPNIDLDADDRPIGGLGIHLVKTVSNHQCYCDDEGANIVEVYFSLSEDRTQVSAN